MSSMVDVPIPDKKFEEHKGQIHDVELSPQIDNALHCISTLETMIQLILVDQMQVLTLVAKKM